MQRLPLSQSSQQSGILQSTGSLHGSLAGDRDTSPSSLLYEVPERENSLGEWQ